MKWLAKMRARYAARPPIDTPSRFAFASVFLAAFIALWSFWPAIAQFTLLPFNAQFTHLLASGNTPVGAGCTIVAGSSDGAGTCTTSATSGSITFATAFATAPSCVVADASATSTVSMPVYSTSTTAITLTTIISGHTLFWACFGKSGG